MDEPILFDELSMHNMNFNHESPLESKYICQECGLIKCKDDTDGKLKCPKCLKE